MRRSLLCGLAGAACLMSANAGAEKPAPQHNGPAKSEAKLVCKTQTEVGSLVARKKRCFSKQDWQRIQEAAFQGGRDIQERNMGTPAGGN